MRCITICASGWDTYGIVLCGKGPGWQIFGCQILASGLSNAKLHLKGFETRRYFIALTRLPKRDL